MNAHEAEELANSMLLNSPLPDADRSDGGLSEGRGSNKFPEENDGEKLPEGGNVKLPENTPTGKLVKPLY